MRSAPDSLSPARSPGSRAHALALVGGAPALDFVNTSSGRGGPQHREHLVTAGDLLAWARHAGLLGGAKARPLPAGLAAPESAAVLAEALALRETIHAVARSLAAGTPPSAAALDDLARRHATTLLSARLVPDGGGFHWAWDARAEPAAALLGPLALSAVGLLLQQDAARIRRCDGEHCGWLFLDRSRNGRRRWCEMSVCGNRAKQQALRARRQGGAAR